MATVMYEFESDDDLASQMTSTAAVKPGLTAGAVEAAYVSPEVTGDAPVGSPGGTEVGEGQPNSEVENAASTESGEEFFEASPEQMAAESGAESAFSDLAGIEGFALPTPAESFESSAPPDLQEAGSMIGGAGAEGDPEFGFLAALIPTLVSSVGPALARAVARKARPATIARVKRTAGRAVAAASTAGGRKNQILSLIAKLLESAESMPMTESAPPVDPALVEAAVAAIESIIGTDDRVHITATSNIPWRRICALRIHFPNGRTYRGTGFFIGPRAVATAGHCVYLRSEGGWARRIEVIPGANGAGRPFGEAVATQFRSVAGWVTSGLPASDYGCIVLPQGSFNGRNLGSFGFAAFAPQQLMASPAVVAGFPGDKPFAQLWGMARKIKIVTASQVQYDIDTMGGQSGAPVYIKRNGQRYCVAIHNYGGSTVNSATRITQGVYQRLSGWSKL